MNTKKLIAAAIAVFIALVPVTVQARHTEDTFYNKYQEGQTMGSLTYNNNTYPVLYGISQNVVDTGNVEMFGLSSPDHLIMLAHSDKAFSELYDNSQNGTKIKITLDDCSVWFEVFNSYWISQNEWEDEQNLYDFYYNDNTPLTLVTCKHVDGVRGRWIVQCTYSNEPEIIVNENKETFEPEVIEIVEDIEEIEVVEEDEPIETVVETPVESITPLNLLKMKKAFVADYIKFHRGL